MIQEESRKMLVIGHKVLYQGKPAIITNICVWHDLDCLLEGAKRYQTVFDLEIPGGTITNVRFRELQLYQESPKMPSYRR